MTIKQQGGIFGRNPTFNDVGASTVDTTDLYTNNISVGTDFQIEPVTLLRTLGNNANAPVIAGSAGAVDKYATIDVYRGNTSSQIGWTFNTYFGALAEAFTVTPSGNIAFPSGQGIDFSATSGTGTSELFSDYEEGSWSPTLNAYAGTPTVSGYYVKIGQMVYVECSIALDGTSDASNYIITGLPFTMASPYLGGGAVNTNDGGVADALVGSDASGRLRLRNSSGSNQTYNSIGVSSTVTLNAQYRAA